MTVPELKVNVSQDDAINVAKNWMKNESGYSLTSDPDTYHERLGFLVNFLTDLNIERIVFVKRNQY